MRAPLLIILPIMMLGIATADSDTPAEQAAAPHAATMPPVVLEFEACVRQVRDERSAAAAVTHMKALLPQMKALLQGQVWQNQEEALILAQILNSAFTLLLTEPPCYGAQELAQVLGELLSLFTGE